MTMSAPSSSGRVRSGVATVESTATNAPALLAMAAAAAMSVMSHVGFAGVSIQMSFGRSACAFAARSSAEPLS